MLTRRRFLTRATAASAAVLAPRAGLAQDDAPRVLRAAASRAQIAPPGYPETALWTFDGSLPGPELRFMQGDRLRLDVVNDIPQPTSVHWHGIRIDNAMDGVPGLTQPPIAPGETFAYDFALPDAGTYWYHSHAQSVEQVERGLYGPLIVEEPDAPEVDADIVLLLDDIRLDQGGEVAEPFDSGFDRSHAGRIGNVVLTNGQTAFSQEVRQGDRLRLRLINAANARIFELGLQGLDAMVVALDGMPLAAPEPAAERLVLAPAQRIDLIADVIAGNGEDAFVIHYDRDGGYAQATFPVSAGTAAARAPVSALPPNPDFPITLAGARTATLLMEGGAMRGLSGAMFNGERRDGRSLAEAGMFWALNGVVGRTVTPLIEAALGETVRIGMANDTAFAHAMHLHGMHFSEVRADGSLGPLRDTLLMAPGETREIAFTAHNPGDWLLHCHMLSHHAAGMGTFVRVT